MSLGGPLKIFLHPDKLPGNDEVTRFDGTFKVESHKGRTLEGCTLEGHTHEVRKFILRRRKLKRLKLKNLPYLFLLDPGSDIQDLGWENPDLGSGINNPDPQYCFKGF